MHGGFDYVEVTDRFGCFRPERIPLLVLKVKRKVLPMAKFCQRLLGSMGLLCPYDQCLRKTQLNKLPCSDLDVSTSSNFDANNSQRPLPPTLYQPSSPMDRRIKPAEATGLEANSSLCLTARPE